MNQHGLLTFLIFISLISLFLAGRNDHLLPWIRNRGFSLSIRPQRFGKLYDMTGRVQMTDHKCKNLTDPPIYMCGHLNDSMTNMFGYSRHGIYEEKLVRFVQRTLESDKELGFIDIGANNGYYTLLAASMGHPVLAVEPHLSNIQQLHLSTQALSHSQRSGITVLQNAMADVRGSVKMLINFQNTGFNRISNNCTVSTCITVQSILIDDLVDYVNVRNVIVKIDIESYEAKAMKKTAKFFKGINVTCIIMEVFRMVKQIKEHAKLGNGREYSNDFKNMVNMLHNLSY